ncbi:hypothetical protein GHK50_00565 [Sinorhizobium medicae]|uniref:Uncharacterized protein n=1 Tax=Sinorhizobium medicae TaxID=110321 RepID=A0A6G1WKS1_9HYPH|nr:hypothetical protein [Sinorhizobium medicae]MQW70321.1 hypothetical protein [Sinorhizobium medicae]MQX46973.1 hypothetical protein [Sinorhizobium medicae]MQX81634.1 hypothetical protein [Sinorhizobium medicae]
MKTPQRRFVVERKSRRRQPKAQTNSIWGDTDLKALARELDDTASHLFNSDEGPGRPGSGETRFADPIDAESVNERADVARVAIPFIIAEVEISKHDEADGPAEVVVQEEESQPASQRRTTSIGNPRKRALARTIANNSEVGNENRKPQAGTVDNPISVDELATLEADNKRLKRLLAEQLRAQNLWLKKMIERLDAE